ncbi:unnamed protein product [Adineta steineri]|uniref:Uncharacterized protein n=2 Tax=Adineta steineri TaxID=433720 RepID=A0A814C9P8_9BILA|nr:unnamed protein product [Adineta steineri]CAF3614875.1 unnamed protein product [Adineta steineri]
MLDSIQASILFIVIFLVQGVAAAMGAMDVIALILGLALLIFGICALIGFYARKRSVFIMSLSASSTRQRHTILGGGTRYEIAELVLSTIPNFELKQKDRILHLFTEKKKYTYAFMQEIQEALDEQQNNIDSLLVHNQVNIPAEEPFAFESQIDTDTYPVDLSSRSTNESLLQIPNELENTISNVTTPSLTAPNQKEKSKKDLNNIKKELRTPSKTKRRQPKTSSNSKQTNSSMRQLTMTQLFDSFESPKSTVNSTPIKQEPETQADDTVIFMPESIIGLAQPSASTSDDENDQNNLSYSIFYGREPRPSNIQPLKRKTISSPNINEQVTNEDENTQNEGILGTPYSGIESEELLYACPMCRNYWLGLPKELRHKEGLTCRHRQRPVARSPEHFWSLGMPSTQTCIERGYGGVLPPDNPIERPRRPRRQHHRKLQEQQQPQQEDSDED